MTASRRRHKHAEAERAAEEAAKHPEDVPPVWEEVSEVALLSEKTSYAAAHMVRNQSVMHANLVKLGMTLGVPKADFGMVTKSEPDATWRSNARVALSNQRVMSDDLRTCYGSLRAIHHEDAHAFPRDASTEWPSRGVAQWAELDESHENEVHLGEEEEFLRIAESNTAALIANATAVGHRIGNDARYKDFEPDLWAPHEPALEGADAHELLVSILHNQHLLNQNIVKAGLLLTGSTDQIDFKNDEIMVELEAHAEDGGGCCCVLL